MKAIWNGSLSFGLINIPIRVYPASEDHVMEFHMLHKKDLSPIRFARICKEDGKEIPYSDIVKGYEYEKGEFVVIAEEDFKLANAKKTSTIEIQHFTDLNSINPIYYEKPYYLEADKKSRKAYQLLHKALQQSQKVAIVNFVFRNKEHLGVVMTSQDALVLIQMRYHAEIRSTDELSLSKEKISSSELKMALSLIDQLTTNFFPEKYHDTYTEELMGVIEQKLKGKKTKKAKQSPVKTQTQDLMQLLQTSMQKTSHGANKKKSIYITPTKKPTGRRKQHP